MDAIEATDRRAFNDDLRDLLLSYLQAGVVFGWPGADGLTTADVLECYPAAMARGEVPDWQTLRRRHPDLTAVLEGFLTAKCSIESSPS